MKNTVLLNWLEKRIKTTEAEKNDGNLPIAHTISKGAKLKVYKEIIEFVKTHDENEDFSAFDEYLENKIKKNIKKT